MDPEKRREIARRGGLAAQASGKAHRYTPEEAREAGRKGGIKLSADRAHMARIGRKGGLNQDPKRLAEIGAKGGRVTQGTATLADFLGVKSS